MVRDLLRVLSFVFSLYSCPKRTKHSTRDVITHHAPRCSGSVPTVVFPFGGLPFVLLVICSERTGVIHTETPAVRASHAVPNHPQI